MRVQPDEPHYAAGTAHLVAAGVVLVVVIVIACLVALSLAIGAIG